jgi:hypothetical protein
MLRQARSSALKAVCHVVDGSGSSSSSGSRRVHTAATGMIAVKRELRSTRASLLCATVMHHCGVDMSCRDMPTRFHSFDHACAVQTCLLCMLQVFSQARNNAARSTRITRAKSTRGNPRGFASGNGRIPLAFAQARRRLPAEPANAQGKERIYCSDSGRGLGGCSRAAFLKRDGRKDAVNVFT